eukprot:scaffold694574_cov55-Attheya_sp.AAC.1
MSGIRQAAMSFGLSIPFCVWWTDTIFSVYKVQGKSMEPSLQDGDVILVRKSDLLPYFFPNPQPQHHAGTTITIPETRYLISKHPILFPGDVVVYKNPMTFPNEFIIKRVVGVGGQYVRPTYARRMVSIPPYGLWLEGDNTRESIADSRTYGSITKNLLVGRAEYILWPPSRWMPIKSRPPSEDRTSTIW